MFDGEYKDRFRTDPYAGFDEDAQTSLVASLNLVQSLERRLDHSERVLQDQLSSLQARLTTLEKEFDGFKGSSEDKTRELERNVIDLANRLSRLLGE